MTFLIFELSSGYFSKEKRSKVKDMKHFFYWGNPWGVQHYSCCFLTEEAQRDELIDLLREALPKGFQLNGETIILVDPEPYWQETIAHLKKVSSVSKREDMPRAWWQCHVCKKGFFSIYLRDTSELMTLHEFLLESMWVNADSNSYEIGSIFVVDD